MATAFLLIALEVRQNTRSFSLVMMLFFSTHKNSELHVSPVSLVISLRRFPGVPAGLQEENGLQYVFEVYERVEQR